MPQAQPMPGVRGEVAVEPVCSEMAANRGVYLRCRHDRAQERLASRERSHADLVQLDLPWRGFISDHERVREVGPVAVDDNREVEQEQVSSLDHALAGRTALLVFAPRARDEIAIHKDLFAQLSNGRGLDHQERVEVREAWPDLRNRRCLRRLASPD